VSSPPTRTRKAAAPLVVLITDPRYDLATSCDALRDAATALGGHRVLAQLRDKEADAASLLATAHALRAVTREVGAQLVINGALAIALAIAKEVAADGIHLPGRRNAADMASACAAAHEALGRAAIVTVAAHDDEDVRNATLARVTAALVSPVFATPAKGPARGLEALRAARAIVDAARHDPPLQVVALGGIAAANAAACIDAGADGVAAIRALHEGVERNELLRALDGIGRARSGMP
jgi:thiamine-phosphate pyrophosphorylase